MSAFDPALVRLYQEKRLVTDLGTPAHLPSACERASVCWGGQPAERHPSPGQPAAALSPPHIGADFAKGRLVVLLENLRNYGGWDLGPDPKVGMRFLAASARAGFAQGHKVLFRGGAYSGTQVWHRAILYAATWLAIDRVADGDPTTVTPEALARAMDLVAIAQHVKCSPVGGRSEQTPAMWAECGRHLLAGELSVLQPDRVIVVGAGDNARAVRDRVLPELRSTLGTREVQLGRKRSRVTLERRAGPSGEVTVLFVPHPATPGGTSGRLLDGVRELLIAGCTAARA